MERPTRYENAVWYGLFRDVRERIVRVLPVVFPGVMLDTMPRIAFGSVPKRGIGAELRQPPEKRARIVLFRGDFHLLTANLAGLLTRATEWRVWDTIVDPDALMEHIQANTEIRRRFIGLMSWYFNPEKPVPTDPNQRLEPDEHLLVAALTESMALFAVGHEYAHAALGHVPRGKNEPMHSWNQEFEADINGWRLAREAHVENLSFKRKLSLFGADMLFAMMTIFDLADSIHQTGRIPDPVFPMNTPEGMKLLVRASECRDAPNTDSCRDFDSQTMGTHPPAWIRVHVLRQYMVQYVGDDFSVREAMGFEREQALTSRLLVGGLALALGDTPRLANP
jgi:hypothetical protein